MLSIKEEANNDVEEETDKYSMGFDHGFDKFAPIKGNLN
jgi:hypothetical protein